MYAAIDGCTPPYIFLFGRTVWSGTSISITSASARSILVLDIVSHVALRSIASSTPVTTIPWVSLTATENVVDYHNFSSF